MLQVSKEQIVAALDYPSLIETLRKAFQENYTVPQRHHHNFTNPTEGIDSTLLLMPAWESGQFLGVKIITVSPNNGKYQLPAVQGTYLLFDARHGHPLAMIEAKTLTTRRTAATSALAADFLARPDSHTLLVIGTGALAPALIQAYTAVRPIQSVLVWGRNLDKAKQIEYQFQNENFQIQAVPTIKSAIQKADIISCATLSMTPLIKGNWLRAGQHLDLVGSYLPNMREADDEVIRRSQIFIDTPTACQESGDLYIPIQNGILAKTDIKADLFALCTGKHTGRANEKEITFFKSVGHALEDLATAKMIYQQLV